MAFNPHEEGATLFSGFDPEAEGASLYEEKESSNKKNDMPFQLERPSWEQVKQRTKGALQGAENLGIGYLNLLPKVNIQKANWAGASPDVREGERATELASYALPVGVFGKGMKMADAALASRPVLNALAKIGIGAGSGAISNAARADKEGQREAAKIGAITGGSLGTAYPIANALLKTGKSFLSKVTPDKLAESVQSAHDFLKNSASNLFDRVEKEASNRGIKNIDVPYRFFDEASDYLPKTRASKNLIDKAREGNYSDIRKLQSDLWKRGTKKTSSDFSAESDEGEEMLDLRDKINESVSKHFKDTGHDDLNGLLSNASNQWRNLRETYYKHPTISKLVHEETREIPDNIVKVLSRKSIPMERVRQSNPLIMRNLEEILGKENAIKNLKKLSIAGGLGAGALSVPTIYQKAKNVLAE